VKLNLLHYEQILIDVLEYQLHVITPISCLQALTLRLADLIESSGTLDAQRSEELKKLEKSAFAQIYSAMRIRHLVFCVSPSVLALAALDNALREVNHPEITCLNLFLDTAFRDEELSFVGTSGSALRESLLSRVAVVHRLMSEYDDNKIKVLKD